MRQEKLDRIPEEMRYSTKTSLTFSMEFMGECLDVEKATALKESNGSIGVSPSATAYFLTRRPGDQAARRYIDQVVDAYCGRATQMFPFDLFETVWTLWNLLLAGLNPQDRRVCQHMDALKERWTLGKGTSSSSYFSIVNADDSAMVFRVLRLAGYEPDPGPLYQFDDGDHFACHRFERDPSTSANIHMLEALKGIDRESVQKVVRWLRNRQVQGGYWTDKWHISPFYSTAHAIIALIGVDNELAGSAVNWILDQQRPEGTWGHFDEPSAEETAYCLQALSTYHRLVEPLPREALQQGRVGLLRCPPEQASLWIGKCLYTPVRVVESAIFSALLLADRPAAM